MTLFTMTFVNQIERFNSPARVRKKKTTALIAVEITNYARKQLINWGLAPFSTISVISQRSVPSNHVFSGYLTPVFPGNWLLNHIYC